MIDIIMSLVVLCFGGVLRYVYIYSSSVAVTVPERTDGALLSPRMGISGVKTPKPTPRRRQTCCRMVYTCGILGGWGDLAARWLFTKRIRFVLPPYFTFSSQVSPAGYTLH